MLVTVISEVVLMIVQIAAAKMNGSVCGSVIRHSTTYGGATNSAASSCAGSTCNRPIPTSSVTHGTAATPCTKIAPRIPAKNGCASDPCASVNQPSFPSAASQA